MRLVQALRSAGPMDQRDSAMARWPPASGVLLKDEPEFAIDSTQRIDGSSAITARSQRKNLADMSSNSEAAPCSAARKETSCTLKMIPINEINSRWRPALQFVGGRWPPVTVKVRPRGTASVVLRSVWNLSENLHE